MTTSDPILDRFADLPVPGKREPVNRQLPGDQFTDEYTEWDANPVTYMFNGIEREFFTISHLAAALGKAPVTIRSWENKGWLPRSPYRSPKPRGATVPGLAPKGKRLWTRAQILGMVKIARQEQVIFNGKKPNERFAKRVLALFHELLEAERVRTP